MYKVASLLLLSVSVLGIQLDQEANRNSQPPGQHRATVGSRRAAGRGATAPTAGEILKRLKSSDQNSDGLVDESELPPLFQRHFADADANKDQYLDTRELVRLAGTIVKPRSTQSTPAVSPEDVQQVLDFALEFDKDNDGGLNAAELTEYAKATALRRAQNGGRRRGRGQDGGRPSDAPKGLGAPEVGTSDPFGSSSKSGLSDK